jgi:hypothetical protein
MGTIQGAITAALRDINLLRLLVNVRSAAAVNTILSAYDPTLTLSAADAEEFLQILGRHVEITAADLVRLYDSLQPTPRDKKVWRTPQEWTA